MDIYRGKAIPQEQRDLLEKFRKIAQPVSMLTMDGEKGLAYVVVNKTPAGIDLVTPVVVGVPMTSVIQFAANAMLGYMGAGIGPKAD